MPSTYFSYTSCAHLHIIIIICIPLYLLQQESLLYFPSIVGVPRHPAQNPRRYRSPSEHNIPFETHMIKCSDGIAIHSWLLYHPENNKAQEKLPTIIFFHGNAGNIGLRLPNAIQMYHYLNANILLVEYRGYGDSDDAKPTEGGLKLDAEGVMAYINTKNLPNVDPRRIFVFGRSLGGAVAFHLAEYAQKSHYPLLAGLIVENTFLSISEMVNHLMPYVAPFKMLILRMQWNSGKIASNMRIPTLFLAGAKDTLVPHSHMLELYNRMRSSKVDNLVRLHVVQDGTHNETWLQGGRSYWKAINKFIEEVFQAEQPNGASCSKSGVGNSSRNKDGSLFQRKAATASTSSIEKDSSVEVELGCDGDAAADMISSVGNFIGMAKEAIKKKDKIR